ncbi:MAG TPA: hypothetical protein ENI87_12195 [bacterium]|nr:hypothetical protein [bacterium]
MKRFPMLIVAALLGAVVSLPAQSRERHRSSRQHRGSVVAAERSSRATFQRPRARATRGIRRSHGVPHGPGSSWSRRATPHVRGHYGTRYERVLVPGYWTTEHVPARYGWVYDRCGQRYWGVIEPAYDHRTWVPARWETRTHRGWVGF